MADQAYERTGRMPSGQKYLKWYIHPGPPEKDYDYYNSDGPWAFGPENEKGRFWIEHTELGGRLGYLKPTSCFYEQPYEKLRPMHPCTVLLHTDPDSPGYKNPIMFKKETLHKVPSMSFYPDFILILFRFYPDVIQILSRFYPDFTQILSKCFRNSLYLNFILIFS